MGIGEIITIYVMFFFVIILLGFLFGVPDMRNAFRDWFRKFRFKRHNVIRSMILRPNKSSHISMRRIDEHGTFHVGSAIYNVDPERVVIDSDGYGFGVWEEGNGEQLDFYGVSDKNTSSAHLADAAVQLALASQDNDPLMKEILKWAKYAAYAAGAAAIMGIVAVYLLWNLGGGLGTGTSTGITV